MSERSILIAFPFSILEDPGTAPDRLHADLLVRAFCVFGLEDDLGETLGEGMGDGGGEFVFLKDEEDDSPS